MIDTQSPTPTRFRCAVLLLVLVGVLAALVPDFAYAKLVKGKCYWGPCPAGGLCRKWPWDIRRRLAAAPGGGVDVQVQDHLLIAVVAPPPTQVNRVSVTLNDTQVAAYPRVDDETKAALERILESRGLYHRKVDRLLLFRTDVLTLTHGDCGTVDLVINDGKGGVGLLPGMVLTGEDLKAPDFPDNLEHLVDDLNTNPPPPPVCQNQLNPPKR
jgi:hypothetical protein